MPKSSKTRRTIPTRRMTKGRRTSANSRKHPRPKGRGCLFLQTTNEISWNRQTTSLRSRKFEIYGICRSSPAAASSSWMTDIPYITGGFEMIWLRPSKKFQRISPEGPRPVSRVMTGYTVYAPETLNMSFCSFEPTTPKIRRRSSDVDIPYMKSSTGYLVSATSVHAVYGIHPERLGRLLGSPTGAPAPASHRK